MGAIFSRPVNYIRTKATNTKVAIETRITNTKIGIQSRIRNTRNAIRTKIDNTKNAITTKVNNVKTGFRNCIQNTKDRITNRINRTTNAVTTCYNGIKNGINTSLNNTRTRIGNRITNTKNAVNDCIFRFQTKCTNAREGVYRRYHKVRDTKLTKWQKFKYSVITLLCLLVIIPSSLILLDVYSGEFESAQKKLDYVHAVAGTTGQAVKATSIVCFKGSQVLLQHSFKGIQKGTSYFFTGVQKGTTYFFRGSKVILYHFGAFSQKAAVHFGHASKVVGEFLFTGSYQSGVVIREGCVYIFEKLCVFSVKTVEGLRFVFGKSFTWIESGTIYVYNHSPGAFLAASEWTSETAKVVYVRTCTTLQFISHWLSITGNFLFEWSCIVLNILLKVAVSVSNFIYQWSGISFEVIFRWLYHVGHFLWVWGNHVLYQLSHVLYEGLNRHCLRHIFNLIYYIGHWLYIFSLIIAKFLQDLAVYVGRFIFVIAQHIWRVVSIILAFLLQIGNALLGAFKFGLDWIVAGVKIVFTGVIIVVQETIVAYMYMLHQYNIYREVLFMIFIGLITLYCTGLIRDRRRSSEDEQGSDSDGEELPTEDEADKSDASPQEMEDEPQNSKERVKRPAKKKKKSTRYLLEEEPPEYTVTEDSLLPAYEELEEFVESEDDLLLDQEVPDIMESSDSLDGDEGNDQELPTADLKDQDEIEGQDRDQGEGEEDEEKSESDSEATARVLADRMQKIKASSHGDQDTGAVDDIPFMDEDSLELDQQNTDLSEATATSHVDAGNISTSIPDQDSTVTSSDNRSFAPGDIPYADS